MDRGPVDIVALAFPPGVSADRMATCLREPVTSGHLSLIDVVFLLRDESGELYALDIEHELFPGPALVGLLFDPHTLLSDADLTLIASSLNAEQQAMVAAVEHVWARETAHRVERLGAEVALFAHVPAFVVDTAFAADT